MKPLSFTAHVQARALGVVRDRRREGIATDLKRSAMAEGRALELVAVVSEVHRANFAMLALNAKLGVAKVPYLSPEEYFPNMIAIGRVPLRFRVRDVFGRRRG